MEGSKGVVTVRSQGSSSRSSVGVPDKVVGPARSLLRKSTEDGDGRTVAVSTRDQSGRMPVPLQFGLDTSVGKGSGSENG